jgi:hypothetical protein
MAISLRTTELGGPAHASLVAAIGELKAGRALAPVAVLVPSNHVGIAGDGRIVVARTTATDWELCITTMG